MADRRSEDHWHLDKRVPVALITVMVSWIVTTVWWASALDNRVAHLENMALKNQNVEARLARIEEGQSWMRQLIERIDKKLEK